MTGDRARLGAVATALLAGDAPSRRAAALGRQLAGTPRAAITVDDIARAPAWLSLAAADRARLGHRAALVAIAPALAASIDGDWLGGLARTAGDDAVDWAMAQAPAVPARLAVFDGTEAGDVAATLLRSAVPDALRDFAAPVPASARTIDPEVAATTVDLALAGLAR